MPRTDSRRGDQGAGARVPGRRRNGLVVGELTIGFDGRPRDPEILLAVPGEAFTGAVAQQETAIRKAHDLEWNTRAMEERLASYKGGRGWQGDLFAG